MKYIPKQLKSSIYRIYLSDISFLFAIPWNPLCKILATILPLMRDFLRTVNYDNAKEYPFILFHQNTFVIVHYLWF